VTNDREVSSIPECLESGDITVNAAFNDFEALSSHSGGMNRMRESKLARLSIVNQQWFEEILLLSSGLK
jgi:hypothetical protein